MSESDMSSRSMQLLAEVLNYVGSSKGLRSMSSKDGKVLIRQNLDNKSFNFHASTLSEVLQRTDADGKGFLQINFNNGLKVLFTDTLVGFKPREVVGLDMSKIPKVVTTPDLVSVFEAIEESMSSETSPEQEVEILKRVYMSILQGGEAAGFDLNEEKSWVSRILLHDLKASA